MANEIIALERVFEYNGMKLDDPGTQHSPADVRDYYSAHYPELTGAAVKGPKVEKGKEYWTFETRVGTKG